MNKRHNLIATAIALVALSTASLSVQARAIADSTSVQSVQNVTPPPPIFDPNVGDNGYEPSWVSYFLGQTKSNGFSQVQIHNDGRVTMTVNGAYTSYNGGPPSTISAVSWTSEACGDNCTQSTITAFPTKNGQNMRLHGGVPDGWMVCMSYYGHNSLCY
jgi:hypothetical protein